MRTYPLVRRRWSNEHIMAALFAVIILYLIPQWLENPLELPVFLAILALSLLLDAVFGFLRYKRLVCSVSAAVTAGILQVITPDVPLWGRLIGITAAIVLGKQLWGGTGKNIMNPAIAGYLIICIIFKTGYAPIESSILLIPALILSVPFFLFRPFAAIGLMGGMALGMLTGTPSEWLIVLVNCVFFGCLVITDPVTATPIKPAGLIGGFFAGFMPLQTGNPALSFAMSILIFNLVSYLVDDYIHKPKKRSIFNPPVIKDLVKKVDYSIPALDLTGNHEADVFEVNMVSNVAATATDKAAASDIGTAVDKAAAAFDTAITALTAANAEAEMLLRALTPEKIMERIEENDVFGCGGAAFPVVEKINAVLTSDADRKYFIINGVECDPGLIHDKWLLHNREEDIYKGIKAVCRCVSFSDVILAVKNVDKLSFPSDIKLHQVKDFYPAGFEKILIKSALKRKFPGNSIPSRSGILVLNVQTLILIYEAVYLGKKVTDKYITVSDMKSDSVKTVKVKIGDSISSVLEAVYPGRHPVFTGGGVMQAHMVEDTDVIEKNTNFIAVSNMPRYKESPFCSNCNSCVDNCPQGLRVHRIASLIDEEKFDEISKFEPDKCINCGTCSYVCPGGRNLSARVGEAKVRMKDEAGDRKAFL